MDRHGTAITNATTLRSTTDMRAPIYYDSNNTGYYINPASTSNVSTVTSYRTYASADIRSPRYYDRDNTGYYTDPASTSVLNAAQANVIYDKGDTSYYVDPASTTMLNAARANIYYDKANTAYYVRPSSSSVINTVYANGDAYIPRMYDRSNTAYYVDPASTSNVNRLYVRYNGGIPTLDYEVATKKYVDNYGGAPQCVFGTSGYCKFPGGLILQWGGQLTFSSQQVRSIAFPIPFPNACIHANVDDTSRSDALLSLSLPTRPTQTTITISNQGGGYTKYGWWSAWGY
jgi:hypothetical protein